MSLFSAAISVPNQYKKNLQNAFPSGAGILVSDLSDIDSIKKSGADYITFNYAAVAGSVTLKVGDRSLEYLTGEAHLFKDEINKNSYLSKTEQPFVSGRAWDSGDNSAQYNIWLSEAVADELGVIVGGVVRPDIGYTFEFKVVGIYKDNLVATEMIDEDGNPYETETRDNPDFILSYDLVVMLCHALGQNVDEGMAYLEVYDVINIYKVAAKIEKSKKGYLDFLNVVDSVKALNLSKALFWLLTFLLLGVGAFAVFNIISMIISVREKAYGLYRLLGCEMRDIIKICFLGLSLIFMTALIAGIFGAFLMNSYFEKFAADLFDMGFRIRLVWYAPFAVFATYSLVFAVYYFKFKRKFMVISPLSILLEEK
jgi:hypothetical protein